MAKRKHEDDGLDVPAFLKISAEDRNAAWERNIAKRVESGQPAYTNARSGDGSDKPLRPLGPPPSEKKPLDDETREMLRRKREIERSKKPQRPADSFTLGEWAKENNIDPRKARAAARKAKGSVLSLEVSGMKYVFPVANKAKLAAIITSTMKAMENAKCKTSAPRSSASKQRAKNSSPLTKTQTSTTRSSAQKKPNSTSKTPKRASKKR